jgi:predicted NAD-dependent protein-ADP-ribosyltransferase YbiA (DUF1768 family)
MTPNKLNYFSKSANAPVGKGCNEFISDPSLFAELASIPNWRRILSNFYTEAFEFEGETYNSVEHVFQSRKIALADPAKARFFTLESKHEIGQSDGSVAQRNRKLVVLDPKKLALWDEIKDDVMTRATRERVKQSELYRRVLLATRDAELWHTVARKPSVRNEYLERIRQEFEEDANGADDIIYKRGAERRRRRYVSDEDELDK